MRNISAVWPPEPKTAAIRGLVKFNAIVRGIHCLDATGLEIVKTESNQYLQINSLMIYAPLSLFATLILALLRSLSSVRVGRRPFFSKRCASSLPGLLTSAFSQAGYASSGWHIGSGRLAKMVIFLSGSPSTTEMVGTAAAAVFSASRTTRSVSVQTIRILACRAACFAVREYDLIGTIKLSIALI